jgi:hypothetical protein
MGPARLGIGLDSVLAGLHADGRRSAPPFRQRCADQVAAMNDETAKTPLDHVNDTVTQLKEMRHYAKNNVELLTTQWLKFDGDLKKLGESATIEDLMTRQGEFYDSLEAAITELEALAVSLQPPPTEE